jgi:hypothetical protein
MEPETMILIAAVAIVVIAALLVLSCVYNTMSVLYACVRGVLRLPFIVYNHPRRVLGTLDVVALMAGSACLTLASERGTGHGSPLPVLTNMAFISILWFGRGLPIINKTEPNLMAAT